MKIIKIIGLRIMHYRKLLNCSQKEVAIRANISSKYLGQIERGEVNSSVVILSKLAKVLNFKMSELFKNF